MDGLLDMEAGAQLALMAKGALSAEDLMRATLAHVEAVNGAVNAIVALRPPDVLLAEARAADRAPRRGLLHGLPMAVKDLADVAGMVTSEGSPLFAGRVADADEPFVARLRAAGAIFIGKTNTPEFGLGSHTVNPVHGATVNAYADGLSAGGSSGGAAVALACRMLSLADGSDMMGSLRNPAGWNNVYGFRPSWGRVPGRADGDAFLHRLSTNGPMARSPSDLALLLWVMAGRAPDALSGAAAGPAGRGLRIGWLADWGGAWPMESGILDLCRDALRVFEDQGCRVEDVTAPFDRDALWQSWSTLRSLSVAAGLGPLLARRETRRQLKDSAIWEAERGLALGAPEILAASATRAAWLRSAQALFERFDALAAPTAQVWPFPVDIAHPTEIAGQEMDSYHRWMEVVIPASLIGLPALAMPAGFGPAGLPMGVQLVGPPRGDRRLLDLAEAYHRVTNWPGRRPPER